MRLSTEQRTALRTLVANPIYELVPLKAAREAAADLPSGASVTITTSVRLGIDATLGLAESLSAQGHLVAPHIAARTIRDRAHLADVCSRLQNAAVRKVFIVGGDGPAVGEIRDGLTVLRTLQDLGYRFDEIGVPAYPEGHPSIPSDVLLRDLRDKQRLAQIMTTQMSFNPGAVASWVQQIRSEGIVLPIHLGIPGVVGLTKLTAIAARIGVVDSTRYLLKHRGLIGHLLQRRSFTPDTFLADLVETLADPRADVRALHVFTMNEVAATVAWRQQWLEELRD